VWIDWKRAIEGGFRFVAYTDAEREPVLGVAHLAPSGEMIAAPRYIHRAAWYFTTLLHLVPERRALFRFTMQTDEGGFFVKFRPVPSLPSAAEIRRVSWFSEIPEATF